MPLRFEDETGERGTITESLEVRYSGVWEENVREVVTEAKEGPPGADLHQPEDPYFYLLIELPEAAPIVEVRRDESLQVPAEK